MPLILFALLFQTSQAAPAQAAPAKLELSRCYSLYNPVALGSEWEYRGETRATVSASQDSTSSYERRERVVALAPASMRLQNASRGFGTAPTSNTADYACGEEGAVQAAEMLSGYRRMNHGPEAPRRSEPGTRWQSDLEMIDPNDGTGSRYLSHYEVVGTETVVVPAGTFEALKVSYEQETIRIDPDAKRLAQYVRATQDMQIVMKGFRWYAPQVGMVRSSFETITLLKGKPQSHVEGAEELVAFRP